MSAGSFLFMVLSLILAWGGFAIFLSIALKSRK